MKKLTELEEAKQDLAKYKALGVMVDSEGGQIAIKELISVIVVDLNNTLSGYKEMPEIELRSLLASIRSNVSLVRYMKKAKSNINVLEDVLKELTKDNEEYNEEEN